MFKIYKKTYVIIFQIVKNPDPNGDPSIESSDSFKC